MSDYIVGWRSWGDVKHGAGRKFKRVQDANALPEGPAHAVRRGEEAALCGSVIEGGHDEKPWPPVLGSRCRERQQLAAAGT